MVNLRFCSVLYRSVSFSLIMSAFPDRKFFSLKCATVSDLENACLDPGI